MVKQRFSTSDVVAEVGCIRQKFLGMRLANIYDINSKTYMLKLARSGEDADKAFVVLESGTRFHTTVWAKEKSDTPSNFTLKLRKHLRTRRLEDVRQLGVDRIVDFTFGSGEGCHHLILELFSQGNVILTDSKYEVLTLLRSHRDDAKGVAIMARHPYPLQTVRLKIPVTAELVREAVSAAEGASTLRNVALDLLPYGTAIVDHSLLSHDFQPSDRAGSLDSEGTERFSKAMLFGEEVLAAFSSQPSKGYIWQVEEGSQSKKNSSSGAKPGDGSRPLIFDEYDALPLKQNDAKQRIEFETLDEALDEFYAKIEGQKAAQAQAQKESAVLSKVEKIRIDQTRRAENLEKEAKDAETKATLIEYNLEAVDGAINAVRAALANGLNWKELKQLIKREKAAGNPVASLIHTLELEQNRMTLLLSNLLDDEEDDFEALTRPAAKVEIDLDLNAHGNACVHFESKKAKAAKQEKTIQQNAKALQAAEKNAQQKLDQVRSTKTVQQLRKPYWFERFNWFITSENYLVLSGRDMQQNELLVKRYFKPGDVYVHAELHGASTTIIKNHAADREVPHVSIVQAGCACVCRSQAWDAKIVTSAWWVAHHQVSKTAPTGEYLPTGSFIIRGKKNFLPPQNLVMGLTFLFALDESSLAGHVGERAVRGGNEEAEETQPDGVFAESEKETEGNGSDSDGAGKALAAEAQGTLQRTALEEFMEGAADPLAGQDRYGLNHEAELDGGSQARAEEDAELAANTGGASRRHLSAHERRRQKTPTGLTGGTEERSELEAARTAERARREAKQQANLEAQSEAAAAAARGKRSKKKKVLTKYAHQDEEDRQLAMQLLASTGSKKGQADKKEARKAKKQAADEQEQAGIRRAAPTLEELAKVGAHVSTRHIKARGPDIESGDMPSGEGIDAPDPSGAEPSGLLTSAQRAETEGEAAPNQSADAPVNGRSNAKVEEDAEVAAILKEEQVELLPEDEIARLREIDSLTGQPVQIDILHHALPMVAPISSIQSYKYRLKLTPGSQRKGKAARQAIDLLLRSSETASREKELMRVIPEMEVINAMIGPVKISMPGLQKLQTKARNDKKKVKAQLNS